MSHSHCAGVLSKGYVTDQMLCASGSSEESCQINSGGPLVVRSSEGSYSLAGIHSQRITRDRSNRIGIYTNITALHDWLANYLVI